MIKTEFETIVNQMKTAIREEDNKKEIDNLLEEFLFSKPTKKQFVRFMKTFSFFIDFEILYKSVVI